jgi:NAD(P)-dependent dehydrogenase (short-subunit alcohol dehydrogenase family)
MRLKDKVAIVVGAGQSPGEGLGNGRATVLRFAQEGAKVLAVDNNLSSAEQTVAMARQSGGECVAFEADVADETTLAAMVEAAGRRWGRVDVLDYNVGVGIAAGDAAALRDHRGRIRPHRHHQPARRDYGLQACLAADARVTRGCHYHDLIGCCLGELPQRGL